MRALDDQVGDGAVDHAVLVVLRLVDHQVVHPGVGQSHSGDVALDGGQPALEPLLRRLLR